MFVALVATLLVIGGCSLAVPPPIYYPPPQLPTPTPLDPPPPAPDAVGIEVFKGIEPGMTIAEVTAVLGSEPSGAPTLEAGSLLRWHVDVAGSSYLFSGLFNESDLLVTRTVSKIVTVIR